MPLKERSYAESVELVLSRVIIASSNVRSVSMVAATGVLRRSKMREDVNLLLNPKEMGELIKTAKDAAMAFHKYSAKLGELRHMYLDFENIQALIFPMPDRNLLLVTLENGEQDISKLVAFISRLLQSEGLIHAS